MPAKSAIVPAWGIVLYKRVFRCPDEPVTVDDQKATGNIGKLNIVPSTYLAPMLVQPTVKGGILHGLACIDNVIAPVKGIYTFGRRSYILCQMMLWTGLKLFDELGVVSLIEFKDKLMAVAHLKFHSYSSTVCQFT